MAAELHIPATAYDAADDYFATKSDDQDLLGAIDAAAPFIVAAELQRLAEEIIDSLDANENSYFVRGQADVAMALARHARALVGGES